MILISQKYFVSLFLFRLIALGSQRSRKLLENFCTKNKSEFSNFITMNLIFRKDLVLRNDKKKYLKSWLKKEKGRNFMKVPDFIKSLARIILEECVGFNNFVSFMKNSR